MDDVLREFLTESNENLVRLEQDIVELERAPGDAALLNSIFRTIHTIKGTCGFLGLERLERVAHSGESVLVLVRDGKLDASPELMTSVLACVDVIKEILAAIERTGNEPAGDDTSLIASLDAWVNGEPAAPVRAPTAPEPVGHSSPTATSTPTPPATQVASDGRAQAIEATDATLRVNVHLLDRLMNLVGELVLSRNQLIQLSSANEDSPYVAPVQRLNRVATDLQEAVMKTRMQPIGNAWGKLPRMVRDLAQETGKRIELELSGAETELDRQILQAIQDPLTHMVRNSADHGIESPATRRAAGKPETGRVRLNAYHEGGHVLIEVSDDGAGLDAAKIRAKAVERGMLTREAAAALTEAQSLRLIFEPGFSTAEKVTNVSGRGVGMDVVRSNIQRIGGVVELSSRVGVGTTVRVRIPLTLAIISGLIVGVSGEWFAIPQIGIVELVRVSEGRSIENVHGAEFLRLRDSLLPLAHLDTLLGLPRRERPQDYIIVVCQVGDSRFGLVVGEVLDTQEIVVKPVGRMVKHLEMYAGCTILGDGRVIMILDAAGLAAKARISSGSEAAATPGAAMASASTREGDRQTLLLLDSGLPALQGVPLSLVARLEEIPAARFERADGRWLVQYRDSLLTIVPARDGLDVTAKDPRPVVVFSDGEHAMGLAVEEIRDIVDDNVLIEARGGRSGVLGVAVVNGRATELLDTGYFLRQAHPDWVDAEAEDKQQVAA
jgi:two-component system chemotaxis sensor kinase CheA